jgi:hypothetical protein
MFEQHMRVAWSLAKVIKIIPLKDNAFSIQCLCLGDWLKVEEDGLGYFVRTLSASSHMMAFHPLTMLI